MADPIEIKNDRGDSVGVIRLDGNPDRLVVHRTAAGFRANLPAVISLKTVAKSQPIPLVSDLHGLLTLAHTASSAIELADLQGETWYTSGESNASNTQVDRQTHLRWYGTLHQLAVLENLRDGQPPQFQLDLWGQLSYLLQAPQYPFHQTRTAPYQIYGRTVISYPKEIWVDRLRRIGVLENVLVEIPLPPAPSPEWQEVWQSLVEARDAFEQGGTTGWRGCVTAVRVALERWRNIESEQLGPDGSNQGKLSDRTKRQRLDNLRWHLHHCSHYWVHNLEAECSRDDALLMISTLSSLMAQRKP